MRFVALLSAVLAVTAACASSPPATTPTPSPMPTPTPTISPGPTSSPSPTAAGRVFTAADFTKSGGCGDVFMWATTEDDTFAVVVDWREAATKAVEAGSFDETVSLPDPDVSVSLQVGTMLSAGFCTDIAGMPGHRVDGNAPAVSGTVELAVRPNGDELFDTAQADLTLHDVVFDVTVGGEAQQWRVEQLELRDILVGWFAG